MRIPYRAGNLWGFCDTSANVILEPKYDSIGFYDISNTEESVFMPGYERMRPLYAMFKQAGKLGLLDKHYEEVLPATYDYLSGINATSGRQKVTVSVNADDLSATSNRLLLACGTRGAIGVQTFDRDLKPVKEIVPPAYDGIDFHYISAHYILVRKNNKWGAYTDKGEKLCDPLYDDLLQSDYFEEVNKMRKRGLVGQNGKDYYLIVPQGERIRLLQNTYTPDNFPLSGPLSEDDKKYILQQAVKGKAQFGFREVLFDKSESITSPSDILVRKKKKIAVWDYYSNTLKTDFFDDFYGIQYAANVFMEIMEIKEEESQAAPQDNTTVYFVRKGNKCGAVDQKNTERVPFIYDGFGSITDFYAVTRQKKKFGVTLKSTIYAPIVPQYEALEHAKNIYVNERWMFCLFKVEKGGKPGFIGENGKEYFVD